MLKLNSVYILSLHQFHMKPLSSHLLLINEDYEYKKVIAKEIFSPIVKKCERIKIVPHYKDECWSIDLIDKTSLSRYNKGFKFIFIIIDNYTKYAWAIPLNNKAGKSVTEAFKDIVKKSQRIPD